MKKHCKYLLCLMFALLVGIPMAQGKETMEVNYASGSSSDFIMGEFEAVRKDDGCVKMKIIVYEIEGKQGTYYALIDGDKYKVTIVKPPLDGVVDCERPRYPDGSRHYNYYNCFIVYKGVTYLFYMKS